MKISILLLFLSALLVFQTNAQSTGTLNEAKLQVTLITPIGTNGTNSINTINTVSFNILAGYHSAVKGFEFGGIANLNRDFANGFQWAGIANYTGGDVTGFQWAGISNVNLGNANAFQFAGISNVNIGSSQIFQGAGIVNYTMGSSNLIQAAGIVNYAEELNGAQLAGIVNFALRDVNGAQLAGIVNAGKSVRGLQAAGIVNATKYVHGAQIAGILNVAQKVEGLQLSVLNVADSVVSGVPIGVLSIIRNGFHEFEIGFSEGLNTTASLKLGVDRFYNIFAVGTQFLTDFRWGVGYGIGTHLLKSPDFRVNLEAISYQINEGAEWTDAYNGLQQLKLTFAGGQNEHVQFYAGPTFNLMVSDYVNKDGKIGSDFPPYSIWSTTNGNTNLRFWIGMNAGIRIH